MISTHKIGLSRQLARPCAPSIARGRSSTIILSAAKRPVLLPPASDDKAVQSLVHTGIRGSLAMLAASALQLDVFSHMHWQLGDALTGLQLAAPVLVAEGGLLALYATLASSTTPRQQQPAAAASQALVSAMDTVYLHNIRYSTLGAASQGMRLALEAGAQLSEELLARGALLGCASAWLASRFLQASVCGGGDQPLLLPQLTDTAAASAATAAELLPCGSGPQWLAAAVLCALMGSRVLVHSRGRAAGMRSEREAAAAEAAARRAVLRYEPLAVQQAAAAAAGEEVGGKLDAEAAASLAAAEAEAVEALAHTWLGARFVLGQACMFGAFITTDNLLASFVAGLAMTAVSSWCTEQYLQRATTA